MTRRPHLHALAARRGILDRYEDIRGRVHRTSDATRVALLAAMGIDGGTERAARAVLDAMDAAERARLAPPVLVAERGVGRPTIPVTVDGRGELRWELELRPETGPTRERAGRTPVRHGRAAIPLPWAVGEGYHELGLRAGSREATVRLIIVPRTCWTVREAMGGERVFGLWTNLYALRDESNWGIGDLGDLRELGRWAGPHGVEFVGINPLHALWNRGDDVSPYSPVSRLYRNPVYLDVATLPELARAPRAAALLDAPEVRAAAGALRDAPEVDYERVWALKQTVLRALRREVAGDETAPDERAFRAFLADEGEPLRDFATFLALDAHIAAERGRPVWWREWPEALRRHAGPAVAEFRAAHAEEVELHAWCQFALDRQLGEVQTALHRAGMRIGLYQDLAVGSSAGGADAWVYDDLFAAGATVGAPPDEYSATGQDWGFPPIDPWRLAARGYDYWIRLVRGAMRHAGALRIDHAMGLRRLYWVPRGASARDGAYVRYPERELFGILALESRRSRALVVAEDLGTVPRGFPAALGRRGVLSSQVLYFERDARGFRPAARYSSRALVTAATHDHAPLPAYWTGADLELRRALDLLDDRGLARARRARVAEQDRLVARLRAERLLPRGAEPESPAALVALVHRFLARTPAPLLGVSVDDLAGESTPVNVPGVGPERYPCWRRKQHRSIEELRRDPAVAATLEAAARPRARARRR